jgi:restriction endonuclease Mrr
MIDHDVGVSQIERYVIKRLDTDYFVEDVPAQRRTAN